MTLIRFGKPKAFYRKGREGTQRKEQREKWREMDCDGVHAWGGSGVTWGVSGVEWGGIGEGVGGPAEGTGRRLQQDCQNRRNYQN
jgi:hypothetical protein